MTECSFLGWTFPPLHWYNYQNWWHFLQSMWNSMDHWDEPQWELYFSYSVVMKLCPDCDLRRLRAVLLGGFYSSGLFSLRSPTELLHIAKCEKSARHIPSCSCLLDRVHLKKAGRRATGRRCWMSVHVVCVHEYTLTLSPGISTPEMIVRWGWGVLITPSNVL